VTAIVEDMAGETLPVKLGGPPIITVPHHSLARLRCTP
jgi:hypothetical protein